jgi:hypothetical protein
VWWRRRNEEKGSEGKINLSPDLSSVYVSLHIEGHIELADRF